MNLFYHFGQSSFGMGVQRSKEFVGLYAEELCRGLSCPACVNVGRLDPGTYGTCGCVFDIGDSVSAYRINIDSSGMDSASGRQEADMAFVSMLVAAGHESEHACQFDAKDPDMALIHVAAAGNPDNYIMNYRYNRREIAAEYAGLVSAADYLHTNYPNVDNDSIFLAYVNSCARHSDYWIVPSDENGFSSMDDVFSAFNDAYDAAGRHVNRYHARVSASSHDAFAVLTGAGSKDGLNDDWQFMFDALFDARDAAESNRILAAASLHVYPDLIRESAGADLPDLSISGVFGRDPPSWPNPCNTERTENMSRLIHLASGHDGRCLGAIVSEGDDPERYA